LISASLYGWTAAWKKVRTGACSTICPAYSTATVSQCWATNAEVAGDDQGGRPKRADQLLDEIEDLRLNRHVETARRLVGNQ